MVVVFEIKIFVKLISLVWGTFALSLCYDMGNVSLKISSPSHIIATICMRMELNPQPVITDAMFQAATLL